MLIPWYKTEMQALGWDQLDIILISGDTYIDSPYIGVAVIGNLLATAGYRVGVIAQPDITNGADITRLGEPELFWGITAGSIDSMVANFTASGKRRRQDDLTPGGKNSKRPDRATIVYANLLRRFFKNTKPLVLGGIEASLRRLAHYDYWDDKVRKSILFDAKADILVYGMAEKSILELAAKVRNREDTSEVRGICYIAKAPKTGYLLLPSYVETVADKQKFSAMFHQFYQNNDPLTARGLCQLQDTRYLVHNPPSENMSQQELDRIFDLDYQRAVHPWYKKQGPVKALETIKFSLTTHRGCYGECNFCSISVHQGRTVISRSQRSIIQEATAISKLPDFKGYILDVGGPTANMYAIECAQKLKSGACNKKRCLFPKKCQQLPLDHRPQIKLLQKISQIPGIKKVFVASGLRYDMILDDLESGPDYLKQLVNKHLSGQMKIAPEHSVSKVLAAMGKPGPEYLVRFRREFNRLNKEAGRKQFLTYYMIAAHPGCEMADMRSLRKFTSRELKVFPEQVQIFTPLPSTYSALMYYTGQDPFTGQYIFVEKELAKKIQQKRILV
ncbi:MAG: YgiQ family radical SAM protein [bacterium]|nr:YgiQ family radical SAM protein [bacterium]